MDHASEPLIHLLCSGVDVTQTTFAGTTSLHIASRMGNLDSVIILLEHGAEINARGENEWYVLNFAIEYFQPNHPTRRTQQDTFTRGHFEWAF